MRRKMVRHFCLAITLLFFTMEAAFALPSGQQVVSGQVSFAKQGSSLTITNSPSSIINWQAFSIGTSEAVRFIQQSAVSSVLNRITGQNPSNILGTLQSNGRVFLINPNGVLFGKDARIDVAGLVASTLNISNQDFLAGRYSFLAGDIAGKIENQGTVTTPSGGKVYLIAPDIENSGIINSPKGDVFLAAGRSVQLVDSLDPDITVTVSAPNDRAINLGQIIAQGGKIGIYAGLINQRGVVNADSAVVGESGKIVFKATKGVTLDAGGTTSASGSSGGQITVQTDAGVAEILGDVRATGGDGTGGSIQVSGTNIGLFGPSSINASGGASGGTIGIGATGRIIQTVGANIIADSAFGQAGVITLDAGKEGSQLLSGVISASGEKGGAIRLTGNTLYLAAPFLLATGVADGGSILVGGDYQGKNLSIMNAQSTTVNHATTLDASATEKGDGGKVVVWSDGKTFFTGSAKAKGGADGGKGGLIEVSGKGSLAFSGRADASAPKGAPGTLLLDPENITIDSSAGSGTVYSTVELADPHPAPGDQHGTSVTELPNGNIVVGSPSDNYGGTSSGSVYLYNGYTGGLISFLHGSTENDVVGSYGVAALTSGNYVVMSPNWNGSAGAVTWGSGTTGVSGAVSAANSLVGSHADDQVGYSWITILSNGNYLVPNPNWNGSAGAVTWGSGTTGVKGEVSAANSLIGSTANDQVGGSGITILSNGNYLVLSPYWNNNAGAVTWGSGTTGVKGEVSAANSLVGSTVNDYVGGGITILSNGNYLVQSNAWNNNAGAVTWGSGTTGVKGEVSAANSLVGSHTNDQVGSVHAFSNGNYLVQSSDWYDNRGAVTWGSGTTGVSGAVSAANSLVGSTSGDRVGLSITYWTNGNYVAASNAWNGNTGAVTWGSGTTGVSGAVSAANSLVGSHPNDNVGSGGVTALTNAGTYNGNYVVRSPLWNSDTLSRVGAVTWVNPAIGTTGTVGPANSLVGSHADDQVGIGGVTALTNGNYVVKSPDWNLYHGAVTWGNGTAGVSGVVSSANSLVGSIFGDTVGNDGVTALTNGNYVVRSLNWNGTAGAVTWGNGTAGVSGVVSSANSLVGSTANDYVGSDGVTALTNGNYLVRSPNWNSTAGAVTWGDASTGVSGVVSATNSLVGSTGGDRVGSGGITALTNGNYLVRSPNWNSTAGAVTWGDASTGVKGAVNATNSLVGSHADDYVGSWDVTTLTNGNYVVRSPDWNGGMGAVTWGDASTGVKGAVNATNSLVGSTAGDYVGSWGVTALTNDNYLVRSPDWNGGMGAVTWGDASAGVKGAVSSANSLVGSTAGDYVGNGGIMTLNYGNYVVMSPNWNNNAGAVTWGDASAGVKGAVSSANSLVGSHANDLVGNAWITVLSNGNYVVMSPNWNGDMGAVTWGDASAGVKGAVSSANSLVGSTANDYVGNGGITTLSNGNYLVRSPNWNNNAGAVTWGDAAAGVSGTVSPTNSLVGSTANDNVGEFGITTLSNGNYVVMSPNWNGGMGAMTWGDASAGVSGAVSPTNSLVGSTAGDQLGSGGVTELGNGSLLIQSPHFNNEAGQVLVVTGVSASGGWDSLPQSFGTNPGSNATLTPATLTGVLNTGSNVALQANNDIDINSPVTANNPGGTAGSLTLQAGRSIMINSAITTGNGNFTAIANETVANGVQDAYREPGAAVLSMGTGASINAGTGNVRLTLRNSTDKTYNDAGDMTIGNITAGTVVAENLAYTNTILSGPLTASTSDITIAAGNAFINAGPSDLSAAGRWLVYSMDPTLDSPGGLRRDFTHYNQTYAGVGTYGGPGTGNGFLYSVAPSLTIGLMGTVGKQYDGTDSAYPDQFNFTTTGRISGDNVNLSWGSANYDSKHVGTGKLVTVSGLDVANARDDIGKPVYGYTVSTPTVSDSIGDITARPLTLTASTNTKVYDGNPTASATPSVLGLQPGDTVTGLTEVYANKMAGTSKTLSVSAYTVNDGNAGNNYSLSLAADTTGVITKAPLTLTASTNTKVYDGNPTATATPSVLGLQPGDTVTGLTEVYANKMAGTSKTLSVSAYTVNDGNAGNNYNLSLAADATGVITPKGLTVSGVTAANKVYDGNTTATVNTSGATYTGIIPGDIVSLNITGGSFVDKNAGTAKTVNLAATYTGADKDNYTISGPSSTTADITPKALTVTYAGINKVYDATTTATVSTSDDRVAGDALTISRSAAFTDKNASPAKTVNVTGVSLTGTDKDNYTVAATGSTTADITKAPLTLTASTNTKVYDGNPTATATPSVLGLQPGDTVTGLTEVYANKMAGTSKTLSVSAYTVNDGNAGNNYNLSLAADATGVITPKGLTVSGVTAANKVYDGNTTATVNTSGATYTGIIPGDIVSLNITGGSFVDKNAGTAKTVNLAATYTGADKDNYTISGPSSTTADITPKALTVTYAGINKVYDATTTATVSTSDDRVAGDALTISRSAAFTDKNASPAKTVNVTGVSLTGTDKDNYTVAATGSTTADITKAPLTLTASTNTKVYDGNPTASATPSVLGLQPGDTVTGLTEVYANKMAGTSKTLSVSAYTVNDGNAGNNYNLSLAADATGVITPKGLTVSGVTAANKVYDGNTTATVNTSGATYTGIIPGDIVSLNITGGSFVDKNAGTAKTVNLAATYTGADKDNYTISGPSATTANIIAAALNIVADNKTRDYGLPNPPLTTGFSGLTGGDTPSVVTGLSLSTTANQVSSAGNYPIVPAGGTAANYTINYTIGTLTVMANQKGGVPAGGGSDPGSITTANLTSVTGMLLTKGATGLETFMEPDTQTGSTGGGTDSSKERERARKAKGGSGIDAFTAPIQKRYCN